MSDERTPPDAPLPPAPPPGPPSVLERTVFFSHRMATRWIAGAFGLAGLGLGFGLGALVFAHHHRPPAVQHHRPAVIDLQPGFRPPFAPRHLEAPRMTFLGVQVVDAKDSGARVTEVFPGSPAERAGIEQGDTITGLGKEATTDVTSAASLVEEILSRSPGDEIEIRVLRDGSGQWLEAKLGSH